MSVDVLDVVYNWLKIKFKDSRILLEIHNRDECNPIIAEIVINYDVIDLTEISSSYLPRAVYTMDVSRNEHLNRIASLPWDVSKKHIDNYRIAFRAMARSGAEKTLFVH